MFNGVGIAQYASISKSIEKANTTSRGNLSFLSVISILGCGAVTTTLVFILGYHLRQKVGSYIETKEEVYLDRKNSPSGAREVLTIKQKIGTGGFSHVYRGLLHGMPVAIKKQRTKSLMHEKIFMDEMQLHLSLSHPGVLELLAISTEPNKYCMVMELMYMSLGSLVYGNNGFPWSMRLSIAIDVAEALTYLHERDILHRDINCENILLTETMHAKISDFGLAIQLPPTDYKIETEYKAGTEGYMAPEIFQKGLYTRGSDIYALGVVYGELVCRDDLFSSFLKIKSVVKKVLSGNVPREAPRFFTLLITQCWSEHWVNRPNAEAVVDVLDEVRGLKQK